MPSTTLRYLLLFAVLVLGILLVLAGFEYGLRFSTGEKTGKTNYRPHPTAIASYIPHINKIITRGSADNSLRTNAIGVRDNDPFCKNANVLLFGDSNLVAEFLPFEKTLGEELESLFDNTICAINYGLPGYGPDQGLSRMRYEIDNHRLSPEVIVFHVFADNDYGDMFRNRIFSTGDNGVLQRTDRKEVDFELRWMERYQAQFLLVRRLRGFAIKQGFYTIGENEYYPERQGAYLARPLNSILKTNHFISRVEKITSGEYQEYKSGRHTTWLGDLYDYWIALNPESEAARVSEYLLGAVFSEAKKTSDEIGACLVVLIQPSEWDIARTGPVSHVDLAKYSNIYKRNYHPRNLTDVAKNSAISSGVFYINLFDVYEASKVSAYTAYNYDGGDNHWNEYGIKEAAAALHEFIITNNCIKN